MGSVQSEAEGSPVPEVTEATSFERLLPVVLRYPLNISILSLIANIIKKNSMDNVTFYNLKES